MTHNGKVTGNAASIPAALIQGLAVSLAITFIGAAVFAYFISVGSLPETSIGYCAMAVVLISSLLGALLSVAKAKHRRAMTGALSGAVYYAALLAITALFFGGQYRGIGVTALLVTAGVGFVILLGLRPQKSTYPRRRKNQHR